MIYPKKTAITNSSGFTLFELFTIICIIGIVFTIGIPAFSAWIPDYRLRAKAKELYTDMHLAKIKALKENDKYKIVFSNDTANSYSLVKSDDVIEKTVIFSSSETDTKILFGGGSATKNATKSGGSLPGDGISYADNTLTFNPRGTGSSGYVYLHNRKGTSYAIGTLTSGVIFIKKWNGSDWK